MNTKAVKERSKQLEWRSREDARWLKGTRHKLPKVAPEPPGRK